MNSKELIQKMEKVVQNNVVAYQSDFYDYDIATITNMKMYERRFWLVRDTGTYLFNDPDIAKLVIDTDNYVYFAVVYKNQYEYEYTSMSKEDFKKELASRCYLLGQAINIVLDEFEDHGYFQKEGDE